MARNIVVEWEDIFKLFVSVLLSVFVLWIMALMLSEKSFQGYYLNCYEDIGVIKYKIFINWENRLDEKVFCSADMDKTLEVYKMLKKEEATTKDLKEIIDGRK